MEKKEPKWMKDVAKTMLKPPKESYGDEEQDEMMAEIDSTAHEDDRGAQ